jgi:hypothetical protein
MANELPAEQPLGCQADIADAAQWSDDRQPGLAEAFVDEVNRALARVLESPLATN